MRPFSLLIKPAGPDCNIACEYCFYACKSDYFDGPTHRMSDEVLETLVKDYLSCEFPTASFAFQGGEPTLMGLDFYRKVIELQRKYGKSGQQVSNALQTNGVLLDEKWCEFLAEYNFLVGISLDGPEHIHDYYRRDKTGRGTWQRVMNAIENCRRYKVEFNILTLLTDQNVEKPNELFDFFLEQDLNYLQFITCVEKDPETGEITDFSISGRQYGDFLCRIFDRWRDFGPEKISIRFFDSILSSLLQGRAAMCIFNRRCSDYMVIEHNGDAFCCDFFVSDEFRLGNILENSMAELMNTAVKRDFAAQKANLNSKCVICRHKNLCRGGCLKDRLYISNDFDNVSYFCEAYKQFFDYSLNGFMEIASEISRKC